MIPRYGRRALLAWTLWRAHRRLRTAIPALAALDAQRDEKARQHRSGARAINMKKRRVMTERLRAELGM